MLEVAEKQEPTESESPTNIKKDSYKFLGSRSERVIFIFFLTLLSCAPIIFGKGIPSHADWHIHMEHAHSFKEAFWEGQFLPRWNDTPVNGYGLPIFNFYAPLVYYLFVALDIFFRNAIASMKWTFIIAMSLSSIFGYLFLRKHTSPISSAIATAFIIFSPAIHIFIYNTNWPTSTMALGFVFLTLYGIDSFDKSKSLDIKSILITSIGYAGMVLSHLATAFIFTLLSIPYFFLCLYLHRTRGFLKTFISSFALGASLVGFYLIPASLEKKFVHTDEVLTKGPLWDFSKNFLYTYLDRNKDEGYAWAIFDHRFYEISNALLCLAVFICITILLLNLEKLKLYFNEPFRINLAIIMFTISFLMMTPVSIFVWLMIKPLHTIQFPWRFTSLVLPFGALIMAYTFDFIGKLSMEKINLTGYRLLLNCVALLFICLVYVDFINMYFWKWVPEQNLLKSAIYILWGNEEYRPNIINNPNWRQFDFKRDFSPAVVSSNPLSSLDLKKWSSHKKIFEVFSEEEHKIRLRTFYFPGWNVYIDENPVAVNIDQHTEAIFFNVPAGKHQVKVAFEKTPIRKNSEYLSLIALILWGFFLLQFFEKKKTHQDNLSGELVT